MESIIKEMRQEEKAVEKSMKKLNIWMIASIVLAVALVIIIVLAFGKSGISPTMAGQIISDYGASQGATLSILNVTPVSSLYEVSFAYQGNPFTMYVTKDGEYMGQMSPVAPAAEKETSVPKTDKPKVELYIWGYCPYGVAAQGPMAEVAELLKGSADFETVLYYAGHGAFEAQQNKIQACIQKNAEDKYWAYAAGFVNDIYSNCSATRDITCDLNESVMLMKSLGIDSAAIMQCVDSEGADLTDAYSQRAQVNGVTGSPTLMINGVVVNAARNSEAYKAAVCSAFKNAPSACSSTLNSENTAASGNCG